jgi:hypothetical protein
LTSPALAAAGNTYIRAMPARSRAITMAIKSRKPYEVTKGSG